MALKDWVKNGDCDYQSKISGGFIMYSTVGGTSIRPWKYVVSVYGGPHLMPCKVKKEFYRKSDMRAYVMAYVRSHRQ